MLLHYPLKSGRFTVLRVNSSTRDDGWPGLKEAYGIDVPDSNVKMLDTGVIYTATQKGRTATSVKSYETHGRIPALDLVVMEDDLMSSSRASGRLHRSSKAFSMNTRQLPT